MPRKKKAEQEADSLVNHPLVRHAIKVLNATPIEPDSKEAVESPFAQPKDEAQQDTGKETAGSQQESAQVANAGRENLLRQFGALADGDATINTGRASRR
jgi:hypothetical protein